MNLAIWYHCKVFGAGIPSEDEAVAILAEQMSALKSSGLAEAASEIHIGVNGDNGQGLLAAGFAPDKSIVHVHGPDATTELPTFALLRQWVAGLTAPWDWAVLYHHSKGVTNPQDPFRHHHRRVMQGFCVEKWRQCVKDLERGYDAVGCNWVDPITRPVLPGRFFAGNFWWARADYLMTLPPLANHANDYNLVERIQAEGWIGSAKDRPKVLDYERPHLSEWCRQQISRCED